MNENKEDSHGYLPHLVAFHFVIFVVSSMSFVALFSTPLFGMLPLFYRGLLFIITISVAQIGVLVFIKDKYGIYFIYRDIIISVLLFAFVATTVFTFLPVTLDRSISVFMLGYMAENSKESFTADDMDKAFIDGYVRKYQAMQRRFDEQALSKNIMLTSEGYRITSRGRLLVKFFEIVADIFAVDKGFVDPR